MIVYPYKQRDHMPKFVIIKNNIAPTKSPKILVFTFLIKNLDISPIKRTLPQVNNAKS